MRPARLQGCWAAAAALAAALALLAAAALPCAAQPQPLSYYEAIVSRPPFPGFLDRYLAQHPEIALDRSNL